MKDVLSGIVRIRCEKLEGDPRDHTSPWAPAGRVGSTQKAQCLFLGQGIPLGPSGSTAPLGPPRPGWCHLPLGTSLGAVLLKWHKMGPGMFLHGIHL